MTVIGKMKQVDWSKMTEDSATVADKIKKKLHIQSKSGLEKFQVIIVILDIIADCHLHHCYCRGLSILVRNGVPKTSI